MFVGDRVIVNTNGRLKWADGCVGTINKVIENDPNELPNKYQVLLDEADRIKPPFGLVMAYGCELDRIIVFPDSEKELPKDDPVNHPNHYTDGKYECIDYMEAAGYTNDGYLFNAVKYISRAGKKGKEKFEEDIQKAIWYLKRRQERCPKDAIWTDDYIRDKGLQGTYRGLALKLIDRGAYDLATEVLEMELKNGSHTEHPSI